MSDQSLNVSRSVQTSFDKLFGYIPNIIGFLVILAIGYIVAKLVKSLANKILERTQVDEKLHRNKAGSYVERVSPGGKPSHMVGAVIFWVIFLYALTAAIGALKIPALTAFMQQVLGYLPNVFAAVLIFIVAAAIAGVVVAAVQKTMGDTPTGKVVQTVVPGVVMAVAMFMILTQLKIAPSIVLITYAALLGMLALTGALAFGLGGREVAGQMWSSAYQKGQEQAGQVKADAQTGKGRAAEQARQAKSQASGQTDPGTDAAGSHRRN